MAVASIILLVVWIPVVAIPRGVVAHRRTGTMPVRFRDPRGSPQWWARLASSLGVLLAIAAPVAELAGFQPWTVLDQLPVRLAGLALAVAGIGATLVAQSAMGDSWRGDVDPDVRTALVTTGPFRLVRNPILTSTAVTAIGLALLVPNVFSALMVIAFLLALQIQVRLVEEPDLLQTHGSAYRRYAARMGRFLPGIGRLPDQRQD